MISKEIKPVKRITCGLIFGDSLRLKAVKLPANNSQKRENGKKKLRLLKLLLPYNAMNKDKVKANTKQTNTSLKENR